MYSKIRTFRTTEKQYNTLKKMQSYKIDVSRFIREAIREKIDREYSELKPNINISQTNHLLKKLDKILSNKM